MKRPELRGHPAFFIHTERDEIQARLYEYLLKWAPILGVRMRDYDEWTWSYDREHLDAQPSNLMVQAEPPVFLHQDRYVDKKSLFEMFRDCSVAVVFEPTQKFPPTKGVEMELDILLQSYVNHRPLTVSIAPADDHCTPWESSCYTISVDKDMAEQRLYEDALALLMTAWLVQLLALNPAGQFVLSQQTDPLISDLLERSCLYRDPDFESLKVKNESLKVENSRMYELTKGIGGPFRFFDDPPMDELRRWANTRAKSGGLYRAILHLLDCFDEFRSQAEACFDFLGNY